MEPLSAFVIDCGLRISEANLLLRRAAVQSAAARQLENSNRVNISGIAAITGIPRGEVSRILDPGSCLPTGVIQGRQNIASRILNAWHRDPNYSTATRGPRELKVFGEAPTFESLVKEYGQGIPARAIIDELTRIGAIQLLGSSEKILAKRSLAINPQITYKKIRDLEAATDDLLFYLKPPSKAAIVEKVSGARVWSGRGPPFRKRFESKTADLLRGLHIRLAHKKGKRIPSEVRMVAHLSVKIVYREAPAQLAKRSLKSRRNLRRNR